MSMEAGPDSIGQIIHPRLGNLLSALRFTMQLSPEEASDVLNISLEQLRGYEEGTLQPASYLALGQACVDAFRIKNPDHQLRFMADFAEAAIADREAASTGVVDPQLGSDWRA